MFYSCLDEKLWLHKDISAYIEVSSNSLWITEWDILLALALSYEQFGGERKVN